MINGSMLRDAMISAANLISNQKQQVDALNVFPVPDGDTGTNMSMTIGAAKRELERLEADAGVAEVSQIAASALLRGARGNSGVILSLLFRGFSKGLAGKKTAELEDVTAALAMGVEAAYKAVMKPTEGTVLTVGRLTVDYLKGLDTSSMSLPDYWNGLQQAAEDALAQTPEMLPVLKKAGVVDAGGKGLTVIFEGMGRVFRGEGMVPGEQPDTAPEKDKNNEDTFRNAVGEFDGNITFTYCTEFIVNKSENAGDSIKLRAYLESIGDCVVVVDDDDIIKCHVHTDNPGKALQEALNYGYLSNMKIENMREQYAAQQAAVRREVPSQEEFAYVPADLGVPFGFVSVAAGEGVRQLFIDLGVNKVVSGGQTMNPSTDDILKAVQAVPAQTVFVLPNNKNIIMAAEQAANLADRKVVVLQTRTIPQGLSAMLAFDSECDCNENLKNMTHAFDRVGTGQITFAARDSDYEGHKIKKDELLALENGKLAFTEKELEKAAVRLVKNLMKRDSSFVTLIYGEDIAEEEAAQVETAVRAKLPDDVELALINGGQPVYYLIVSVE